MGPKRDVLGYDGDLRFEQTKEGLFIHTDVKGNKPVTFKIKLR